MTLTDTPTILIPKGGGWYWISEVGGEKVQLSKEQVAEGNYDLVEAEDAPIVSDTDDVELLKAKLAQAAKQIAEQKAEIEASKPTVDIRHHLFETIEDVKKFYPAKYLRDLAQAELAAINKTRMKEGFDRITYDEEEWEAALAETIESLLADRSAGAHTEGPLLRTLKMVAPDGSLRQIPYEGQFNNIAGSLEDGYRKYTKKGFKRTDPMLCPSGDCWEESAKEKGEMVFTGYCSQDHFDRTEAGRSEEVPGVTTSAGIAGRRKR